MLARAPRRAEQPSVSARKRRATLAHVSKLRLARRLLADPHRGRISFVVLFPTGFPSEAICRSTLPARGAAEGTTCNRPGWSPTSGLPRKRRPHDAEAPPEAKLRRRKSLEVNRLLSSTIDWLASLPLRCGRWRWRRSTLGSPTGLRRSGRSRAPAAGTSRILCTTIAEIARGSRRTSGRAPGAARPLLRLRPDARQGGVSRTAPTLKRRRRGRRHSGRNTAVASP